MTKEEFTELYGVQKQYLYSLHEDRCHAGNAPTIAQVVEDYGLRVVMDWVESYIQDLQAFTSATRKLNTTQVRQLSFIISTQFSRQKVTEYMLFVIKAKSCEFGKFFNTIDPMDIVTALRKWQGECDTLAARRHEEEVRERDRQERQKGHEGTITYEQAVEQGIIKEKWKENHKAKSGETGKFFNTIDPKDIVTVLRKWQGERDTLAARRNEEEVRERDRQERQKSHEGAITYEQAVEQGIIKEKWKENHRAE